MDFSSSPSSSSYSQYKELARAAGGEGGERPWLTVASPDMMNTVDATTHTATTITTTTTTTTSNKEDEYEAVTTTTTKNNDTEITEAAGATTTTTATTAALYMERREHMFDKVVTPSDVGKLNRLVIPKQHAEKYFPLDSASNEKGLLLNFEDRSGKSWRFRYSYWNSSQSYVMTKGWSRFVKEKKLDAGDIISFQRGVGDVGKDIRFFIDWRRRQPEMIPPGFLPPRLLHLGNELHHPGAAIFLPGGGYNGISLNYPSHHHHINQYRYHTQQYMPSSPSLIVRPSPPLPPPPPLAQQQLPMVVRDHYKPHYPGQMKQMNMINMIQQQYPGHQYQHDRGMNIIGRDNAGGVHHQYYHHQQYHDQDKWYDHGREAVLSPARGPSTSSNIVYMNNIGSAMDRERGCHDMVPIVQPRETSSAAAAPKQLRLFGVNMDCSQDEDSNVVFGVDVVAASQHHNNIRHHGRDDHRDDHELTNSQNAAISAPFQLRLYDGGPTNSMSLRTSSQSQLQEKGKSSSLTLDLGI